MKPFFLLFSVVLFGCSSYQADFTKVDTKLLAEAKNNVVSEGAVISSLPDDQKKQALSTLNGNVIDELGAPSDPTTAWKFGLGLSTGDKTDMAQLERAHEADVKLIQERDDYKAKLDEMGSKYESEHNKSTTRKVWEWLLATFGIGGLIALCVFFPVAIPIIGTIIKYIFNLFLGWITSIEGWVESEISKMAHTQTSTTTTTSTVTQNTVPPTNPKP